MKSILFIISFFLLIFSGSAAADCDTQSCNQVKVTRMFVRANGSTVIRTSGNSANLTCDAGPSNYITLDRNASNYDAIYSLILSAHVAESLITVRVNTDASPCQVIYVVSDK